MDRLLNFLPNKVSPKVQFRVVLLAVALVSLAVVFGWGNLGLIVSTLVIFPIILIGWFYGTRAVLVAGIVVIPYLALLEYLGGRQDWDKFIINSLIGFTVIIGLGVVSAWASENIKTTHDLQKLFEIQIIQQQQELMKIDSSNSRYRAMIEQAGDVVYMTDLQGNFEYINPFGVQLTGYNQSELSQMNYLDLVEEEWQEKVLFFYKNQARQGLAETSLEFPIRTKDGLPLWVEQTTNLLIDNDRLTGYQSIMRDITQRKMFQEELAIAKDTAESANKMKSRLLAMLSHDIRTPLNAILWYAEMVKTEKLGEINTEQKDTLQKIISSSHQVNNLIHNLLNSAELESGNVTIRIDSFQPTRLVKILSDLLDGVAQSKGITLEFEIMPNLPESLDGDYQRIQQILINLVSNAIKFTSQGGVTVRLSLVDRSNWKLEVIDTGPGIPEHTQADIFQPFNQLRENQPIAEKGVGLGLSIVKEFTELMGGEVGITSQVGKGSNFWVILPTKPKLEKINVLEEINYH